jgi:hypothetical protein
MPFNPLSSFLLAAVLASATQQLGSEDWATREAASQTLAAFGPLASPALERAAKSDDAEVRRRAAELLAELGVTRADRLTAAASARLCAAGFPDWPWVDSLPQDYPGRHGVISRYLGRARAAGLWGGPPDFPAYRQATYLLVRDQFEGGASESEVAALLRQMIAGDAEQCRRNPSWRWAGVAAQQAP